LPFTLMTTSHKESLEEALWFALYCAVPPEDLKRGLDRVVLVADTQALQQRCTVWVTKNAT
jgi:hypothetical protein